ncbi:peptide ABC transporter substrate-binding protein [Lactiplantibacillus xiangfangensis]|uniref:Lipoprotein, peptide binding protein oppa like protein n=1 Tax=Lactiplantibacillus xiangfangensis TaxID=942150 RepID=A0A0R2MH89_9LACO|nr:peptide ABC transporter substrate-binding protein [Lactiplantibacillus xiangfangensis]KRO10851.1 lipoprotein, peptide binding protein oppa like protein [Lactiplantibacillus xiangfangensis]
MKWKFLATAAAVTVTAGGLLVGCGSKSADSNAANAGNTTAGMAKTQVLNWSENGQDITTLDPSMATDVISGTMISNSQEGLYRLGKDSKVTPGIATGTTVSKDKKTYTFTLRKNAKWSNGDKVTAQDFVYGWRRTVNPKTASQYAYLYSGIKNADKITAGKASPSTLGIKADGKYKLTVTLEKPMQYFKLLMGFVVFFPQNQHAVQKYGKQYGTSASKMVYDGPFKMTGWKGTNSTWTLVRNTDYWDKKHVYLTKINDQVVKSTTTAFNLFQSGKLDAAVLSGQQVKNEKNNSKLVIRKSSRLNYLEFNQKKVKALANTKLRQAMSLTLDRKQLVNDVLGDGSVTPKGFATSGLAKDPTTGKDFATENTVADSVTQDNAKAKKLWQEGLKEVGKKSLTVTLTHDDTDQMKAISEYVQGQLEKELPGLKVNSVTVPYKTRIARETAGNFQLVISAWQADFSDPISDLGIMTSKNDYNFGKWTNSDYDSAISAANATTSTATRWEQLAKAEKIIGTDQGVAPLSQNVIAQMVNPKLKGLVYNTAGINYNFKGAYMAK